MFYFEALKMEESYKDNIVLSKDSKQKLLWLIQNLEISHGMSLINQQPQSLLQTDASFSNLFQGLNINLSSYSNEPHGGFDLPKK